MTAAAAHQRNICDYIASLGSKITFHSADPGTTGANLVATTPASATTTWGVAVDGTGPDVGRAVATGSAVNFQVPASTTVTHYGVWNGSTFLRGKLIDSGITTSAAGPVSVDFPPKTKFQGGQ